MISLSRVALVLLAGVVGCGSDSTLTPPPPTEPEVPVFTIVSGDAQKGPFDVALAEPLVVSLTKASGDPIANVKVYWQVVTGDGSISPSSSVTDKNGKASVIWTLGPDPNRSQQVEAWSDPERTQGLLFSATGQRTVVLHYDGTSWTRALSTENFGVTVEAGWAASPSLTFAGGWGCFGDPPVLTNNSGVWSGVDRCPGEIPGPSHWVASVWGLAPNDVWALGWGFLYSRESEYNEPLFARVYHFDGSAWTVSARDESDATHRPELLAGTSLSNGDVIVVGRHGRIIRYAGSQWLEQASGTSDDLYAVWGDRNSANVFAVGPFGTIVRDNGAGWQIQKPGTGPALLSVWGSSANDVFAVGGVGTILHFDGTAWSVQTSGTTETLRSVWGSSSNSVFAVGNYNTILRYNGVQWSPVSTGVQMHYTAVWGTSSTDVFVSGITFKAVP
jgi:hypothetical protein